MSKEPKVHSITSGTILTVAMRWSDRMIGLVSTLILARLLLPEDFGIIAMASLAIGLATVLFDVGVNIALIQNKDATQDHYDSAWTLRLIQSVIVTLLLVLISPWIANYFHDQRVELVVQALALSILIGGFENIGIIAFQKHMQFGAEFRFLFSKRVSGFLVTITLAFLFHSYWALVFGTLVGRIVGVGLSYYMHTMRPKISTVKIKEIFSVSQWMMLRSIGGYLNNNLHKFVVGRSYSSAAMGGYTLADEISAMPTSELLAPLNRVLFPAFSEVKNDLAELKKIFLLAQSLQILVAVPVALGLALVAEEAILILLGDKWSMIIPFVQVLALIGITQSIGTSSGYILMVLGKFRASIVNCWFQVILFVGLLYAIPTVNVIDIAWLKLASSALGLGMVFYQLLRAFPIVTILDLIRSSIRPLLGALAMSLALLNFPILIDSIWVLLTLKVLYGAIVYVAVVMVSWLILGRPEGAESYLLDKVLK